MAEIINTIPNNVRSDLVSTLQFEVEKLDYSKLKASEDNQSAQSGGTMYVDLPRMDFVINGTKIGRDLVKNFLKEAEDNSNNRDLKRLINKFDDETIEMLTSKSEERKTLLNMKGSLYKQYNYQVLREAFKKLFTHAQAKVPNEPIIQELITNCNQAGYVGAFCFNVLSSIDKIGLLPCEPKEPKEKAKRAMYIDCIDPSYVKVKSTMVTSLCNPQEPFEELVLLRDSLEFKLQSQGDKVKYTDGKLSLTLPKELEQDKNLLAVIKDFFIAVAQQIKALFGIEELKVEILYGSEKPQTKMEETVAESHPVRQI